MANPFRGEAQIGASEFVLVCDINALCEIRAHFGGDLHDDGPLSEAMARIDSGDLSIIDQRAILAALLRNRQPGATESFAGSIMSDHPDAIMPAIQLAVQRAMPEPVPGKKPMRRTTAHPLAGILTRCFGRMLRPGLTQPPSGS